MQASGRTDWYMTPGIVAESDPTGALKSEYVFFDGSRVARKDFPGGAVSYYFSDYLKTASVITNAAGNIKEDEDYYPWGGELQFVNGDSNHYKFTSKERHAETGLDYFGARHYSNGLGRFITPDWADKPAAVPYAVLDDPQSLNLYSYVRNIPTVKVDTDGHDGVGAVLEKTVEYVEDGLAKLVDGAEGALAEAGGGASVAGSSRWGLLAGPAIYIGAMLHPASVGQSNADEIAERDRLDAENAQKLGQGRGAGEEKSQSDDANDRARTNGGLAKPDKGPGSVPKDQRDSKRVWTKGENDKKLAGQGGNCAQCGKPIPPGQARGHHIKRHADGGKTNDKNHAVVCNDCHTKDLHK